MHPAFQTASLTALALLLPAVSAYNVMTAAGTGSAGVGDGAANLATFSNPVGGALRAVSNELYFTDQFGGNSYIRKVDLGTGETSRVATGTGSTVDGDIGSADFGNQRLTVGFIDDDQLLIVDEEEHRIRLYDISTGMVSTVLGGVNPGEVDGVGTNAQLRTPKDISIDSSSTYAYVVDHFLVRRITLSNFEINFVAGSTTQSFPVTDGYGTDATFFDPSCITVSSDAIYVFDDVFFPPTMTSKSTLRKIDLTSDPVFEVTTLIESDPKGLVNGAFSASQFDTPKAMRYDSLNNYVYVADSGNDLIRLVDISGGMVSTIIGGGASEEGEGTSVLLDTPQAIEWDNTKRVMHMLLGSTEYLYKVGHFPTSGPTTSPVTAAPSVSPLTASPSVSPITSSPTLTPSQSPVTNSPSTLTPTESPITMSPTSNPVTSSPTVRPSNSPMTLSPSVVPSVAPSSAPIVSSNANCVDNGGRFFPHYNDPLGYVMTIPENTCVQALQLKAACDSTGDYVGVDFYKDGKCDEKLQEKVYDVRNGAAYEGTVAITCQCVSDPGNSFVKATEFYEDDCDDKKTSVAHVSGECFGFDSFKGHTSFKTTCSEDGYSLDWYEYDGSKTCQGNAVLVGTGLKSPHCAGRWRSVCRELPPDDDSCFEGSQEVTLESGHPKAIEHVQVGDKVMVWTAQGQTKISDVIFVPHPSNSVETIFVEVVTVSGRSLKMTPDHMLPLATAASCNRTLAFDFVLGYARDASNGMCILTIDGPEVIVKTRHVKGKGVYTVVTAEPNGHLVVNGVVASSFGTNHHVVNAYYGIHRMLHPFVPSWLLNSKLAVSINSFAGYLGLSVKRCIDSVWTGPPSKSHMSLFIRSLP